LKWSKLNWKYGQALKLLSNPHGNVRWCPQNPQEKRSTSTSKETNTPKWIKELNGLNENGREEKQINKESSQGLKGNMLLNLKKQIKSANVALAIKKGSKLYNWNSKQNIKEKNYIIITINIKRECSSSDRMGSNNNDDMNL